MTRECRQLVAMYFVFSVFLIATTVDEMEVPRPAAGARLVRTETPARPSLAAVLRAALQRPGVSLAPVPVLRRWRITPRDAAPPLVWNCAVRGNAALALQRLMDELSLIAGENDARVLRSEWGFRAGRLCLYLDFGRGGKTDASFCLQAETAGTRVAQTIRRRSLPAPRPLPTRQPVQKTTPRPTAAPNRRPMAAIVVDDVGTAVGTERFLALPASLTLAILPFAPHAEAYARQAVAAGRTVILHLPLEAISGKEPGPGTIRIGWTKERILEQLEQNLRAVPGAIGVNNHMGSLGTADAALMTEILKALKGKGLFFLDSRTWNKSVAARVARSVGERYTERDIFLDPEGATVGEIQIQLRRLISLAKRHGRAVGICHANRPNTLAALEATLPEFAAAGVEIRPLAELVHN